VIVLFIVYSNYCFPSIAIDPGLVLLIVFFDLLLHALVSDKKIIGITPINYL
jgi:hypothetical protein